MTKKIISAILGSAGSLYYTEVNCEDCGKRVLVVYNNIDHLEELMRQAGWTIPNVCPTCQDAHRSTLS